MTRRGLAAMLAGAAAAAAGLAAMLHSRRGGRAAPERSGGGERASARDRLATVRHWGAQYSRIEPGAIAATPLDLLVIEPMADNAKDRAWSPTDVATMRRGAAGGERLLLAYLAVGEADATRPWWQAGWRAAPPAWLGGENPNWPGSFHVRYWDPAWQRLLFGNPGAMLDRILAAGYDGVLLDRVDAFADWRGERPEAMADMVALVRRIGDHARGRRPAFLLAALNAEPALAEPGYRAAIDAVVKESLLTGLSGAGTRNSEADVRWSLERLLAARGDGIALLGIEYLAAPDTIATVSARYRDLRIPLFVADRRLDRLPQVP